MSARFVCERCISGAKCLFFRKGLLFCRSNSIRSFGRISSGNHMKRGGPLPTGIGRLAGNPAGPQDPVSVVKLRSSRNQGSGNRQGQEWRTSVRLIRSPGPCSMRYKSGFTAAVASPGSQCVVPAGRDHGKVFRSPDFLQFGGGTRFHRKSGFGLLLR
jgi:hypothetical protein